MNAGIAPVVATIVVTPHFENGSVTCDGPAKTFTITVNPTAEVNQPTKPANMQRDHRQQQSRSGPQIQEVRVTYTWTNDQPTIGSGSKR